tara:strand:+ start:188 stop:334 length:147 start_codon:yes stop_codon:yes gene_type:complete
MSLYENIHKKRKAGKKPRKKGAIGAPALDAFDKIAASEKKKKKKRKTA